MTGMSADIRTPPPLRARAPEAVTSSDQFDAQLRALSAAAKAARSSIARITWRIAVQRRTSRVARILRLLPAAVNGRLKRTKEQGAWRITVDGVNALVLILERGRTIEELGRPLPVLVWRPALVDLLRLAELERDGTVRLVLTEQG